MYRVIKSLRGDAFGIEEEEEVSVLVLMADVSVSTSTSAFTLTSTLVFRRSCIIINITYR